MVPLVNRRFEWGVAIATFLSVLSIVPRHCALLTNFPHPKLRKLDAVLVTPQPITHTPRRLQRAGRRKHFHCPDPAMWSHAQPCGGGGGWSSMHKHGGRGGGRMATGGADMQFVLYAQPNAHTCSRPRVLIYGQGHRISDVLLRGVAIVAAGAFWVAQVTLTQPDQSHSCMTSKEMD